MAIKLPDPGNGIPEQKTGNDEWTNMKILRDNFADNSNAASRLVGTSTGNLMAVGAFGLGAPIRVSTIPSQDGLYSGVGANFVYPEGVAVKSSIAYGTAIALSRAPQLNTLFFGVGEITLVETRMVSGEFVRQTEVYTDNNTTKDSNGFLKGKSPVTRLHSDRLEHQGDDKELEQIEFEKRGVGDYLLKNTTGLASEGWYIELPQDANKNPLIAVTYDDDGKGNLSIKTYKRKFDFETVSIVADTDNPVDIPETRWVDLRFNELPQEQLDEPIE